MKHQSINIIIVDDETIIRHGLSSLLQEYNINTIAVANNGQEALSILKKKKPHVLLLDLEMPILNGSKTLDNIKRRFPDLKVIILSAYYDEELIKDYLNRGAKAFVSKNQPVKTVAEAIHSVYAYGFYEENLSELFNNPAKKDGHYYKLIFTKRELEIISLICEGKDNACIAAELFLSLKTIEGHLTEIYKKVKVKTRTKFLKHALESGLQFLGKSISFKGNPLTSN